MIQKFIQLNLFLNINNLYLQSQYLEVLVKRGRLTKLAWLNCQCELPGTPLTNQLIFCWSRFEGGKRGGKIQTCFDFNMNFITEE